MTFYWHGEECLMVCRQPQPWPYTGCHESAYSPHIPKNKLLCDDFYNSLISELLPWKHRKALNSHMTYW